jgi:ATP-dependent 26S proteasome regulatory subunit
MPRLLTVASAASVRPPWPSRPHHGANTDAEWHSVSTEAGLFAISARRKSVSEKDFLGRVDKVMK